MFKIKVLKNVVKKRFKVVEVSGRYTVITHNMYGTQQQIDDQIDFFKARYENCEFFGNEGMVIWEKRA